ncbi:guanitoxin biosynthesis heme-dependent pre-guanitoxin N-hydroxylase GntA [Mesonia sp. K7]|uniref:guanitoxin biosynthesis heme-dependent pre-guanitoxin N-hydroxylase GntA n=1 Tax=Mesonia sp. K7 TaxID=2218606 RepID=UPI000DA9CD29|nr:guanitoxin biosynthesis heme-dependent pre-guanitoxin N-hydroxylase GntA [Mesonia sp. K7]PZD76713.1 YqcI/YcgG family protein [Mesonia sp. K7]
MKKTIENRPIEGASPAEVLTPFKEFILGKNHPCLMAQTVFQMKEVTIKQYPEMGSKASAVQMLEDIKDYLGSYDFEENNFQTFIATFPFTPIPSERVFEELLWQQLQWLHEVDDQAWDPSVSDNPDHHQFSFSLAGKAFYIVGMHPQSFRLARQAPFPTMVFNLHWQFEKLREMGTYDRIRNKIRKRDKKLQGSINPVLKDFGQDTEAKQYSGRKVEEDWKCPFHPSKKHR